jgi:histidine ammonia-lyase
MTDPIDLDGRSLTAAAVEAVARRQAPVRLAPAALGRMRASHEATGEIAQRREVYGRTTGVGANRAVRVDASDAHGSRLLRSHAAGSGPLLPQDQVRAGLVVRLNQLLAGGSGAAPELAVALADALNAGCLPRLRKYGGVGTGDLTALAETALTLAGEQPWNTGDRDTGRCPTAHFGATDALAFMSSNAVTLGCATLAVQELRSLAGAAADVAALSFLAARGNDEALSAAVGVVTPFPGAVSTAARLRSLVGDAGADRQAARIQDPYAFRTMPQTLGVVEEALATLECRITGLTNTPCENPLVDAEINDVVHHGGFAVHHLTAALDATRLAVAKSTALSQARITQLLDPGITGLSTFLTGDAPGSSGLMALEYTTASALARARHLANPVSTQTVVLSGGAEEDASFAGLAAELTLEMVEPCRTVVAGEMVTAVRALRMRGERPTTATLGALFDLAVKRLPQSLEDRRLSDDLDIAHEIVAGTTSHPTFTVVAGHA